VLGAGLGAGLGVWVRACLRVGVVVWVSGGCVMLGAGCVFGWCWLRSGKFYPRLWTHPADTHPALSKMHW